MAREPDDDFLPRRPAGRAAARVAQIVGEARGPASGVAVQLGTGSVPNNMA